MSGHLCQSARISEKHVESSRERALLDLLDNNATSARVDTFG
jgi:hypothetical protein